VPTGYKFTLCTPILLTTPSLMFEKKSQLITYCSLSFVFLVQDDGLLHTSYGTPNYVAPEVMPEPCIKVNHNNFFGNYNFIWYTMNYKVSTTFVLGS
jgi:hypothetical protein